MSAVRRPARRRRPNYFAVGLAAIVVVVLVSAYAFTKSLPFVSPYGVDAVFSSSTQLRNGSPVRIAGVDVGKVAGTKAGPGNTTIVSLDIKEAGRPVHTDAELRIRPRLFLEGGFYVELSPGSPAAPELEDGGTIPLSQTKGTVQFHQILSTLDRNTRDSVRGVLDELSTGLDGGGAEAIGRASVHLAPALRDLAVVAEAAQGSVPGDLSRVVRSSARITRALASRDDDLGELVTSLSRTTAALAADDAALAGSVRELDGVLRSAPAALSALDRALPPTERLAAELRPGLVAAPPVLDGASDLLAQVDALVRRPELPSLVSAARPLLAVLPPFERDLQALFGRVRPVMDCLGDRVIPVLNSSLDDGALSTRQPIWQEFAHALVGLAGASQNFDRNGQAVRFLVGVGQDVVSTGAVPGAEALVGRSDEPIVGSRPVWLGPGTRLPFRPDLPCSEQQPPDLGARSGGTG